MRGWCLWHPVAAVDPWELTVLERLGLHIDHTLPTEEGVGVLYLAQFVVLVEETLVRRVWDYLLKLAELMPEGGFSDVMLNRKLVKDVIEVLIQLVPCLLIVIP